MTSKTLKKLLSLFLVLSMLVSLCPASFAAAEEPEDDFIYEDPIGNDEAPGEELDEVLGGVLSPVDAKLVAVSGDVFGDKLPCTDSLMNAIAERIPAAADPTAES